MCLCKFVILSLITLARAYTLYRSGATVFVVVTRTSREQLFITNSIITTHTCARTNEKKTNRNKKQKRTTKTAAAVIVCRVFTQARARAWYDDVTRRLRVSATRRGRFLCPTSPWRTSSVEMWDVGRRAKKSRARPSVIEIAEPVSYRRIGGPTVCRFWFLGPFDVFELNWWVEKRTILHENPNPLSLRNGYR